MIKEIKRLFALLPPDFNKIRTLLSAYKLTPEDLAEIAIDCAENCFCEYRYSCNPDYKNFAVEDMHSNYIIDSLNLLIEYGLDPNIIIDDDNVIWKTMWIDAPNVGASALRLLLEHGGNPNHFIPAEYETVFDCIAAKVSYDEYSHEFFHTVQCWLVLMGFGASWSDGKIPLTMLGGHSVEIFKQFEKFDYTIEPLPQVPGKYGCWIMHIYNIETGEEVARYG